MTRWKKGVVSWTCDKTLYLSVPFTWLLDEAEGLAQAHKGPVVAGGPAVKLMGAPWADETPDECPFDVLAMHNPCATFTTRGCPNQCRFCAVPKTEGEFRELAIWKPAPIVCDNNLTAASPAHFERVIESLMPFPLVDFNQGFEARRFEAWHAEALRRPRRVVLRFAFDHTRDEGALARAMDIAKAAGLRDCRVMVLFGFDDTPEDAIYRCEWIRAHKALPCPMRYHPLDAAEKNAFYLPAWDGWNMAAFARYYYRQRFFGDTTVEEFARRREPLFTGVGETP